MDGAERAENADPSIGDLEFAQVALVSAVAHLQHREDAVDPTAQLDVAEKKQVLAEDGDRRIAEIELCAGDLGHFFGEHRRYSSAARKTWRRSASAIDSSRMPTPSITRRRARIRAISARTRSMRTSASTSVG